MAPPGRHEFTNGIPPIPSVSLWCDAENKQNTHCRVPPTVHKIDSRSLGEIERHTAGLQTDEEHGNVGVVHCEVRHERYDY